MELPATLDAIEAMLAEWEPRLRELRKRRGYLRMSAKLKEQRGDPAFREKMRRVSRSRPNALPPEMTAHQKREYEQLRRYKIGREEALRAVMPKVSSPAVVATGPAADSPTLPRDVSAPAQDARWR